MEFVPEPVHLNVLAQMAVPEPVVGIVVTERVVVEPAPTVTPATSVVAMEHANASLTVTTSTAVMMVAEELAVPVKMELSAKEQQIFIQVNVTLTVTLTSELKSENSRPTLLLHLPAVLMSLARTPTHPPINFTPGPILDSSRWMFLQASTEPTALQPLVLDTKLILKPML